MPIQAPAQFIADAQALAEFAGACREAPWLALDTEFIRERTYFPELCLLQLSLPGRLALIDAQAGLDLGVLAAPLSDPGIIKLMHAPRQDQEVLAPLFATPVAPLRDTQLAAALSGAPPQAAYSTLVADELGIDLGKSHARTDWSRRPLGDEQLRYAADDVRYLPALWQRLQQRLEQLGRLDWLLEEMASVERQPVSVDPAQAWLRLKGLDRLEPRQRGAARALAAWREERAIDRDRPRQWILADRALLAIAQREPQQLAVLGQIEGVEPAFVRKCGEEILALLARAAEAPPPDWDDRQPDRAQLKKAGALLRERAAELGIEPAVLATKADLGALLLGQADCRLRRGWRRAAVGEWLERALAA